MSTYRLHYLNGRGRGEVSRLIFAVADQEYEDIRYEHEQWLSHKGDMPLGQVPVLEVDGVKLPQSVSIARFLGKQFNLAGKDHLEQAKVDAVGDTINDLIIAYVSTRREQDPTKRQELQEKFRTDQLPKHFQNLEVLGQLYGNGGPFFVGNHLTWADLFFYDVAESMLQFYNNCLDEYPWLKQNPIEVKKHSKISAYLDQRPETPF